MQTLMQKKRSMEIAQIIDKLFMITTQKKVNLFLSGKRKTLTGGLHI